MEEIIKEVKKPKNWKTIITILVGFVGVITASYAFYDGTNTGIHSNHIAIEEMKKDVELISDKVSNNQMSYGVSLIEIKSLYTRVEIIEETQIRTEDKIDKIIELIISKKE